MPVNARVLLIINQGPHGWTELYWRNTDNTLQDTYIAAAGLASQRRVLLGKDAVMVGYRVSDESIKRDSLVNTPQSALFNGVQTWPSAPAYMASVVRQEAGNKYRRMVALRGIPIEATGVPEPVGTIWTAYSGLLQSFGDYLARASNGWKMRVINKEAGNPLLTITAIQPDLNPARTIITIPGIVVTVGQEIHVEGRLVWPSRDNRLSGYYQVVDVVGAAVVVNFTLGVLPEPYTGKLKARVKTYTFVPITKQIRTATGSRKTGRPFGSTPGHRSIPH